MAISNPIIHRELVGLLRTRRALAVQLVLATALAALVVLRWPGDAQVNLSGEQSQAVLRLFGYGLMVALILLCPVFPATAIVREKQAGTLALLLNSPLSAWDILIGKLAGAIGFALLLLVLSLPAATACYVMGGVDFFGQIMLVYLILLLAAVQYATLALWISTRAGTADSALRLTYGAILLLAIAPLAPKQFTQGLLDPMLAQLVDTVACISPIPAMMDALGQGGIGAQGLLGAGHIVLRYGLFALLSMGLFMYLTLTRLNYRMLDRNRSMGKVTDEQSQRVRLYRRIMYLWFFDPQRRTGLIGPFTNPVMVKEFRTQKFGRSHWMMRIFVACIIISLGLMFITTRGTINWGVETLGGMIVILQSALILLVAPSLAAGIISSERERGGWTLLQMSPLSTFTIVTGKLLSASFTLLILLIATLPAYGIILAIKWDKYQQVLQILITLVLLTIMAMMISAAVSSLCRRTAAATAASYSILLAGCGGTLLFWLGLNAPFSRRVVEIALRANPLATALSIIDVPSFKDYALVPYNWYVSGAVIVLSGVVLLVQTWRLTRPS